MSFLEEFSEFVREHGISGGFTPVPVFARSEDEARAQQSELQALVGQTSFVVEDRWRSRPEQTQARILAHAGVFTQVYARNCELRRIDKPTAAAFLEESHDYADALCRYRYGLFIKRLTGEKQYDGTAPAAADSAVIPHCAAPLPAPGTLVAVAEFSNLRNLTLDGTRSRSCQWIRYASLPGIRVEGGMGKVLGGLIKDADPDDVMTYADLEWSDGRAYRALGFEFVDYRRPVLFRIDPITWQRTAVGSRKDVSSPADSPLRYLNFGSARYRLRLR